MSTVIQIVNFIGVFRVRSSNHRQFRALLEEIYTEYGDIILHCDVSLVSRCRVRACFVALLPHLKEFLAEKKQNYPKQ